MGGGAAGRSAAPGRSGPAVEGRVPGLGPRSVLLRPRPARERRRRAEPPHSPRPPAAPPARCGRGRAFKAAATPRASPRRRGGSGIGHAPSSPCPAPLPRPAPPRRARVRLRAGARGAALGRSWGKGNRLGSGVGGGVSVITRKRLEMRNEQIGMERNRCHCFVSCRTDHGTHTPTPFPYKCSRSTHHKSFSGAHTQTTLPLSL